jgi:two-component system, OmpR family, phosphate regulon sensor histidine kinase PhoR
MLWDRPRADEGRRADDSRRTGDGAHEPSAGALEHAPVMALLLDADERVVAANGAARDFFSIEPARLPASLVEVTLEARIFDVVRSGVTSAEAQLVHHRRTVSVHIVPAPQPGERLLFLTDLTELRRLATVRQEFVANLVHELKTPITSLRLTAESLLNEPPAADRRRFAERIIREADLITKIIDNLRQLGDIEMGSMRLDFSRFDVGELVKDSVVRLGIDRPINAAIPDGLVVETDRAKLVQALDNLLDNAVKFSPPGSPIDVAAETSGGELVLSVRDRGPGISPEHWSRVFERFYKVDRARPREAGGFGLGLAITKHLVQVLGGRIWTETARDGGQVFHIALPRKVLTGG